MSDSFILGLNALKDNGLSSKTTIKIDLDHIRWFLNWSIWHRMLVRLNTIESKHWWTSCNKVIRVNCDASLESWLKSILSDDAYSWSTLLIVTTSFARWDYLIYEPCTGLLRISFCLFWESEWVLLRSYTFDLILSDDSSSRNWDDTTIEWGFCDSILELEFTSCLLL